MFGHTYAELCRAGVALPDGMGEVIARALAFLLRRRHRTDGLIEVVHPWESGCDDSPRWDDLCPGPAFDADRWRRHKIDLLGTIERGAGGEPLHNPAFAVASIGFNALVAFNAMEYAAVTGDHRFDDEVGALVAAIDARFDPHLATWIDAGPTATGSGQARTVDALLALLVSTDAHARRSAVAELCDEDAHASAYGPRGVHIGEPTYARETYWRGPVWPQLAYLLWVALRNGDAAEVDAAEVLRTTTIDGAIRSGLAEYWDGDSGRGLGAIPQSWTGLALVLARAGSATV